MLLVKHVQMSPRDNSRSDCTAFLSRIQVLIPRVYPNRIPVRISESETLVLFDKLEVVLIAQEKTLMPEIGIPVLSLSCC